MNNSTTTPSELVGWMPSDSNRGSLDILWTCTLTIALCIWVSTHPNTPSRNDKWYHEIIDKANLACIGLLGPDYLFGLAFGQFMNARRSVRKFAASPELRAGREWTLTHAFFADMGGFLLTSPDYPDGFPIDAEQLYYLVKHQHVDFPNLKKSELKHRDKSDSLTKIITLCQACSYLLTTFRRVGRGYPITTLELTAVSFCFVMLGTSACWFCKPVISSPTLLKTRDDRTVADVRNAARRLTHPHLPDVWYKTPFDFLSGPKFHMHRHWSHYNDLTIALRIPLFGRPVRTKPWDRVPGSTWYPPDSNWSGLVYVLLALMIQVPFSLSFLLAWNFYFPTRAELFLWRFCAVYHALYTLALIAYFLVASYLHTKRRVLQNHNSLQNIQLEPLATSVQQDSAPNPLDKHVVPDLERNSPLSSSQSLSFRRYRNRLMTTLKKWALKWEDLSEDQDPDMYISWKWTASFFIPTVLYLVCRLWIYAEDIVGLRSQPVDVYKSVNWLSSFLNI